MTTSNRLAALLVSMLLLTACGHSEYVFVKGAQGPKGDTGVAGTSCTQVAIPAGTAAAPFGGSLITCLASSVLIQNGALGGQGAQGIQGAQGATGTAGADGLNGTPGTTIQAVSLCPGVTSYPSKFVEQALCVEGNLYGVYSTNGGFLAYLPEGDYSSNAVGSSCNFHIAPNCAITN